LIRDLGSRNGVRVNGRLQEEARLHSGDELAIGPILFRLEEEIEQVAPPRPAIAVVASSPAPAAATPRQRSAKPRSSRPESDDVDLVPLDDI
jgi:pSer/pThr/pTyr-binding forkhead associated (FHA) protein